MTDFEDGTDLPPLAGQSFGSLGIADNGGNLEITHDNGVIVLEGLAGTTLTSADVLFS